MADLNLSSASSFLVGEQKLYKLGGRKFVLMAINPIGCSPMAMARLPMRVGCLQVLNRAAHLFNVELKSLVDDLNAKLPSSRFVFVNSYKIVGDIIKDPNSHGTCTSLSIILVSFVSLILQGEKKQQIAHMGYARSIRQISKIKRLGS